MLINSYKSSPIYEFGRGDAPSNILAIWTDRVDDQTKKSTEKKTDLQSKFCTDILEPNIHSYIPIISGFRH